MELSPTLRHGAGPLMTTAGHPHPAPGAWALHMSWHDLLFMHWPVSAAVLRPRVPQELEIDTFGGEAWLGVVPFHMTGVRARYFPGLPGLSAFAELNVRTYVSRRGRGGVWFFSLDAANAVAVHVARRAYHLPYYTARMSVGRGAGEQGEVRYTSTRTHAAAPPAQFSARYRPTGPVYRAQAGNLDYWFTERYSLFAADPQGRLYRGEVEHARWPLQPAEAEIESNTMTEGLGVAPPRSAPLLHFAAELDVVATRLRRV